MPVTPAALPLHAPAIGRSASTRLALAAGLMWISAVHAASETVEGFAEPNREITLAGATESGTLTKIQVREGDTVKQGEVLATMDCGVLEASLEIARRRSQFRGRLDAALAELNVRKVRAQKLALLRRDGHASAAELERAEADLGIAQAQLALAQEELELAQLECQRISAQIEQRIFRSPIDGVVSQVKREVGESLQLSDPELLTVVQLDPLRVKFPTSVASASALHQDQVLQVQVPDLQRSLTATIEVISPVLDAKSGTVQVTCVIPNGGGELRSGMRCLLQLRDDPEAKEVPANLRSDL